MEAGGYRMAMGKNTRSLQAIPLLISICFSGVVQPSSGNTVGAWGGQSITEVLSAINGGLSHIAALRSEGSIVTWGENLFGHATPLDGDDFVAIAAGSYHGLALKSDGSIVGWGADWYGQATPPDSNDFVAIAAGEGHSLALKADGSIVGWGKSVVGDASPPEGNDFVAITTGANHSLALKSDGSIYGWGLNEYGQATPPEGNNFVAVAAGTWHSLALRSDGTIVGWGRNYYGEASPPDGNDFVAIAAGHVHSLALKSDGSITGWGGNLYGQAAAPVGKDFVAISAGGYYSLALKSNGSIVGWGGNDYGQATPPNGNSFVAIAAGWYHGLAIENKSRTILQFKSGFEPNTYILEDKIKGIDNSGPSGANSWDNLTDYLPWVLMGDGYFEGGSMEIARDPIDSENHVLHLHTFQDAGGYARSQWSLEQVHNWYIEGEANLFEQQFYRFRMLIPNLISTFYTYDERSAWYMIWESHTWEFENTRHGIYIGKLANSNDWNFLVVQRYPGSEGEILYENEEYQDVIVPMGEWFTFEIFFKYHETDGEFYASIKRDGRPKQTIADFKGRTKYGTKLHDQMMFKLYHDADYIKRTSALGFDGIHQYYDDFEIWSGYPRDE